MSRIKDLIQESPVHERRLELSTYPVEGDQLIVEGQLRDDRLVPGFHWDGRPRPSGIVHWICVRMLVGGWPLSILDAEAEMPSVPHELCPSTSETVKKIIGLSIVSGYSEEVRRRLGGIKGCTHMTHLIVTMGPAAIHGYWTQRSRERHPVPRLLEEFPGLDTVINSCQLWRKNGPLVKMLKDTLGKT